MRINRYFAGLFAAAALCFTTGVSAHAAAFDAGASMTGTFSSTWTATKPDITTATSLGFKTGAINFSLDPSAVSGDFAWDGSGSQPSYTMNPDGTTSEYAGHIGGSTSTLSIGNLSFNPATTGKDFLTWYVDSPSGLDKIHFDITSEQVISSSTTGSTKNLSVYLLGYAWDSANHWSRSLASLNLTVSQTTSGTNNVYSWAATWASPPSSIAGSSTVPEPASFILLGVGLTGLGWFKRRQNNQAIAA